MQFVDAGRGWAVGFDRFGHQFDHNDGLVLRTTDGGATWTSSSVGPSSGLYALSFLDENVGWVVGFSGDDNVNNVFATEDGGVTWTSLPTRIPGNTINCAVRFVDRLNGWILGTVLTPDGLYWSVILHTPDGGLTWAEQLRADQSVYFSGMDFVSATIGWVSRAGFLPEQNRILFTSDGGATWTEQTYPGRDPIAALDFISPSQGWGAGAGKIIHTEDGGQSWAEQPTTSPGGTPDFGNIHFIDADHGWAIGGGGLLFKTTTGGKAP